jgi:hypothetical protein
MSIEPIELICSALILNDYGGDKNYAQLVKDRIKSDETRYRRTKHRGDLVICCGASNSVTANAGKALCIVNLYDCRPMQKEDEPTACIDYQPNRFVWRLKDWRWFSRDFEFRHYYVSGPYQGIFKIRIPGNVEILSQQPSRPLI